MRYLYVDPRKKTGNYGDHIIGYATEKLMAQYLPEPDGVFDSKTGEYPPGQYDFMIVPGVTMITAGAQPGLESISEFPWPTYCLAGAVWTGAGRPGVLVRRRILFRKDLSEPDLRIVNQLKDPVGARDPFTFDTLHRHDIETLYTGCPTILGLPADNCSDDGYVLFSFGRRRLRKQAREADGLRRRRPVVGIVHEEGVSDRLRAAGWRGPIVEYTGDIELYLSYFRRASMVVTGRLHGALPGLRYGKPVFYFGTRDTRTSLLNDLGVPIYDYDGIHRALDLASDHYNRELVDRFRRRWDLLMNTILSRHGNGPNSGVRNTTMSTTRDPSHSMDD